MWKESILDMQLVKYLLIVLISLFASITGQVNTESMRSEENRFVFSSQFSLEGVSLCAVLGIVLNLVLPKVEQTAA